MRRRRGQQKHRRQPSAQKLAHTTSVFSAPPCPHPAHDRERGEQQKDDASGKANEERALRPVISRNGEDAKERERYQDSEEESRTEKAWQTIAAIAAAVGAAERRPGTRTAHPLAAPGYW